MWKPTAPSGTASGQPSSMTSTSMLEQQQADSAASRRISDAVGILSAGSPEITAWDESMIRQLVDTVKVLSANKIRVYLRGGMEIEQTVEEAQVKWCS